MAGLKLPPLPDRSPVKLTVTITAELNKALIDYAGAYRAAYGQAETVADIVPYMLLAFIEGDRSFARSRTRS
jgi:hypothetical protein